ncbi:MAG TPA: DUF4198 domain-containing protein [Nevskiaceae bacterium]|nr:DUF4198 domain-containing protein [Nevskiaceae bacterium]
MRLLPLLLCLLAAPLAAHDLWLEADRRVYSGHPGPQARAEPDQRLSRLRAFDAEGRELDLEPGAHGPVAGAVLLLARFDERLFSRLPGAGRFQPGLLEGAEEVRRLVRQGKTLLGPGLISTRAIGEGLELVPLTDPHRLSGGALLALRAYWQGQPLSSFTVVLDQGTAEQSARADASGVVRLPLRPGGVYRVEHRGREPGGRMQVDTAVLYLAHPPP